MKMTRQVGRTLTLFAASLLYGCGQYAIMTFNAGTTEGWQVAGYYDDKGTNYGSKFAKLTHNEENNAPNKFPCTPQTKTMCDTDQYLGSLAVGMGQGSALTSAGFPADSQYWQVDLVSPDLVQVPPWQGITGAKAYVGDMYGIDPGHVSASMFLRVQVGNTIQEIVPNTPTKFVVVSKTQWTALSFPFTLPSGSSVRNVGIRLRGDWKSYKLYDGAIFIDNVDAIK